MGAEPVVADGLDAAAIRAAVVSARPEVIIHEMTDLADATDLRHFDRAFANSNRLRTLGTDYLLAAGAGGGRQALYRPELLWLGFRATDGAVKTEADELDNDPPAELRRTVAAMRYLEQRITGSSQPEGIVLRYGAFYGPGTGVFASSTVQQIRHRRVPLIGDGAGWWSFVHVDDAATATVRAVERGKPGNIYNITDNEPAQVRDWLPALAEMLGAKPPLHLPVWIARLMAGEHMVALMTRACAASNAKVKKELDWQPAHSSWREDLPSSREIRWRRNRRRELSSLRQPSQRLALEPGVDAFDHLAVVVAESLPR